MNEEPIVIERAYNASPEKVWKALTDITQMKHWYFDIKEFKPEPGFKFTFYEPGEAKKFLHRCEVTEVIPGKKLVYSWSYAMDPAITYVSFELYPEGDMTRLKLTHTGVENFSADNPDLKKQNFVEGWTEILGTSLKSFLEE